MALITDSQSNTFRVGQSFQCSSPFSLKKLDVAQYSTKLQSWVQSSFLGFNCLDGFLTRLCYREMESFCEACFALIRCLSTHGICPIVFSATISYFLTGAE